MLRGLLGQIDGLGLKGGWIVVFLQCSGFPPELGGDRGRGN